MIIFRCQILGRLLEYVRLIRLDKPVGILLLLWPTLTALWIAGLGFPPLNILLIFFLGTILMRSAGCAINDYADYRFDPKVQRTKYRPLAQEKISRKEALFVAFFLMFLAFLLIRSLNWLVLALAGFASLVVIVYPYVKRFFPVPQLYLGFAFSFGILMAFAALQNDVPAEAWYLFIANVCWTIAYDTEYALVDLDDDVQIGIKTSAITFGRWVRVVIAICYLFFLLIYAFFGYLSSWSVYFWLAWCAVLFCCLYHLSLIKEYDADKCFAAFKHNQWVGFVLFLGVAANYL